MKLKFFANYRDVFGCKERFIDTFDTVDDLIRGLCLEYGQKADKVFYKNNELSDEVIILVNGRHIKHLEGLDTKLIDTDTIAIFPVVAGG